MLALNVECPEGCCSFLSSPSEWGLRVTDGEKLWCSASVSLSGRPSISTSRRIRDLHTQLAVRGQTLDSNVTHSGNSTIQSSNSDFCSNVTTLLPRLPKYTSLCKTMKVGITAQVKHHGRKPMFSQQNTDRDPQKNWKRCCKIIHFQSTHSWCNRFTFAKKTKKF